MKKKILIIGGTGIIGVTVAKLAYEQGHDVTTISLERCNSLPKRIKHIVADKYTMNYSKIINDLPQYDAVFDIVEYSVADAFQTYVLFRNKTDHIIVLSTSLIYDRHCYPNTAISENTPSATVGSYGGYVDSKLDIESFWSSKKDINVTLLRPYHILGERSLLGNLPLHNRDPLIVEKIQRKEPLTLFNSGDSDFNFLHPLDLAETFLRVANKAQCYHQAYNVMNPTVYSGREYMTCLGDQLMETVHIETISYEEAYGQGWEMTLLPHCYDVSKLQRDIDFCSSIPLEIGIRDALTSYPVSVVDTSKIPVFLAMNKGDKPQKIHWMAEKAFTERSKDTWNHVYSENDATLLPWYNHKIHDTVSSYLSRINPSTDTYVVGCGTGDTLQKLEEMGFSPNNLFGTDISDTAILKARDRYPQFSFKAIATQHLAESKDDTNVFDWLNLHQISPADLPAYLNAIRDTASDYLVCYIYNTDAKERIRSYSKKAGYIYMHSPSSIKHHMSDFEIKEECSFEIRSNNNAKVQRSNRVEVLWLKKRARGRDSHVVNLSSDVKRSCAY